MVLKIHITRLGLGGLSEKIRQADVVGVEEFGF